MNMIWEAWRLQARHQPHVNKILNSNQESTQNHLAQLDIILKWLSPAVHEHILPIEDAKASEYSCHYKPTWKHLAWTRFIVLTTKSTVKTVCVSYTVNIFGIRCTHV